MPIRGMTPWILQLRRPNWTPAHVDLLKHPDAALNLSPGQQGNTRRIFQFLPKGMRSLFLYTRVISEGGPTPLLRLKAATQAVAEAVTLSLDVGSLLGQATGSSVPSPRYTSTNDSMMSSQILVMRVFCTLLTEDHPPLTAGFVRIKEWLDRSTTRASHGTKCG